MDTLLSIKCDPNENKEKVAEHNFKKISPAHRLDFVISITLGWFFENPDKTMSDLEDFFRRENLDIFLVAGKKDLDETKYKLVKLNNLSEESDFMLFYSCKPKDIAEKEIEIMWGSYQKNYEKLNNCGVVVPKDFYYDHELLRNKDLDEIDVDEDDTHELLKFNKVKIDIKIETLEENFIRYLHTAEEEKIELEPQVIDEATDGSSVLGVFYGEELYCRVGVIIGIDDEGDKILKYVDLKDDVYVGFK